VERPEPIIGILRERGYRITPQREAIVAEVMRAEGHITPQAVARRVQRRMPAVNPSTVYRTLDLLEEVGVVQHSGEGDHVHLTCSRCGTEDDLSMVEADSLRSLIEQHRGFLPDLTHFAISGLCAACRKA
jgi:Fur family ferric uptake transcriptional regulator